jgi:HlyD family secretion protein
MRYFPVLCIALLLNGCSHQEEAPPKTAVAVKVARTELADVRLTVTAPATIYPRQQASISSRITAHIRELRARKADTVAAGQLLAVLESRDIEAQRDEASAALTDAQANLQKISAGTLPTDVEKGRGQAISAETALNQAQKTYTRRSELYKQGAIPGRDLLASETDLKQAQAAYDVAKRTLDLLEHQSRDQDIRIAESQVEQVKAKLANVEVQLQFAEIRSPFAAAVTEQFMYPGDLAKPENPIFIVMDLSVAVARTQIPESQAGSVKSGQLCSFMSVDASGDAGANGRITVVNRTVDPAKRTVEVWCEISNAERRLRAGAFGSVTVTTGTAPNSLVVPIPAIQFAEGTRSGSAYVVDARQIAHKVEVETGERSHGNVQVTKGLNAGDLVIVEGGYGLPDGTQVRSSEAGK